MTREQLIRHQERLETILRYASRHVENDSDLLGTANTCRALLRLIGAGSDAGLIGVGEALTRLIDPARAPSIVTRKHRSGLTVIRSVPQADALQDSVDAAFAALVTATSEVTQNTAVNDELPDPIVTAPEDRP